MLARSDPVGAAASAAGRARLARPHRRRRAAVTPAIDAMTPDFGCAARPARLRDEPADPAHVRQRRRGRPARPGGDAAGGHDRRQPRACGAELAQRLRPGRRGEPPASRGSCPTRHRRSRPGLRRRPHHVRAALSAGRSQAFPPYAAVVASAGAALADARVAGAPVQLTGTDALFVQSSDATGPGLLAEITIAGRGGARGARARVRLGAGGAAAAHRHHRDPGDVPGGVGPDRGRPTCRSSCSSWSG